MNRSRRCPAGALRFGLAMALAAGLCAAAADEAEAPSRIEPHPRLVAAAADWKALAEKRRNDAALDALCAALAAEAESTLSLSAIEHKLIGRRMLNQSREFIRRTLLRAFAWRTTGDGRFLESAKRDLAAVCAFGDWNPSHFLDVAEMSAGVAFAYDWLYDGLSADERQAARAALVKHALEPARNGHATFKMTNNWGQVCAGGLALAALALMDEEPQLSRAVLANAQANLGGALAAYKPDGVYPEGPSYWAYGTQYTVLLDAALKSALGEDWGLLAAPGLASSALFIAYAAAPTGKLFAFADSGSNSFLAPPLWYLAAALGKGELVDGQRRFIDAGRKGIHGERFAALVPFSWISKASTGSSPTATPASTYHFHGAGENPVAVWRSGWNANSDWYFAIKAGGSGVNHGHMDGGSFVLERDGVRWADDLGMQDYESLESKGVDLWNRKQNSDRWNVFRISAASHNVLTIDGAPHRADGLAKLTRADESGAEIDLTPIFLPGAAARATRAVRFDGRAVILTDRLSGAKPGARVRWAMTTRASIELDASGATLRSGKASLQAAFASSSALRVSALDLSAGPSPFDAPNPGVRQLIAESEVGADGSWTLETRLGEAR